MSGLQSFRLGNYKVLDLMSRGETTSVYRGEAIESGQQVVIKLVDIAAIEDGEIGVRRFQREVEIVNTLDHPSILKILAHGAENRTLYFATEFMAGGTLARLIRQGPMAIERVTEIFVQMADALTYAHEHDVIHRDLKPGNILFNEHGSAYLADFGIAKIINRAVTQVTKTATVVGTPGYMAPEQWLGETLSPRTDIYAMGVILFEQLTGHQPFVHDDLHVLMNMHVYDPPPLIHALRHDLPMGLVEVMEKALAKSPELRFETMGDFLAAYQRALTEKTTLKIVPAKKLFSVDDLQPDGPSTLQFSKLRAEKAQPSAERHPRTWQQAEEKIDGSSANAGRLLWLCGLWITALLLSMFTAYRLSDLGLSLATSGYGLLLLSCVITLLLVPFFWWRQQRNNY